MDPLKFLTYVVTCHSVYLVHLCWAKPYGNEPKLLLVSFDGFRWDYLDKVETPNFARIYKNGVRVKWIKNMYVTKTSPNHYSIVTGLYEESHGIIGNRMYDPVFNQTFTLEVIAERSEWFGGEPIWVTNQLQNSSRKSGVYFWTGGNDCIKGTYPTFNKKYNQSVPFRNRTDSVIKWLTEDKVNLALLYYHEPDHTGHHVGPDSEGIKQVIKDCDSNMGYLLNKLEEHKMLNDINIIVTSDHGMAEMPGVVYLNDYLSPDLYFTLDGSPYRHIWPKEGQKEIVYNKLKGVDHLKVYLKEEIPVEYHYRNNRRVAPIFVMTDIGWNLVNTRNDSALRHKGEHGWNNSFIEMHPFFIATGPAFKKNYFSDDPFNNVDIYPLMCHILKLKPAENNGSLENVMHILVDDTAASTKITYLVVIFIAGVILCLVIVGGLVYYRKKSNPASRQPLPEELSPMLESSEQEEEDKI